ncbi:MAG: hypothetical protein QNK23_11150 [Crocinitomicaceae bacterium]|nr:hypothetical protein [Crocinitomicaceae bacterium]
MDSFPVSIIVLLVFVLIARLLNERALKQLSIEEKAKLIDLFSSQRIWSYVTIIVLLGGFFAAVHFKIASMGIINSVYFALIFTVLGFFSYSAFKKFDEHNYPKQFTRLYLYSMTLRIIGLCVFIALLYSSF